MPLPDAALVCETLPRDTLLALDSLAAACDAREGAFCATLAFDSLCTVPYSDSSSCCWRDGVLEARCEPALFCDCTDSRAPTFASDASSLRCVDSSVASPPGPSSSSRFSDAATDFADGDFGVFRPS